MKLILELSIAVLLLAAISQAGELRYNCSGGKLELSDKLEVLYETATSLQELLLQAPLHGLQETLGPRVKVSRVSDSGTEREEWQVQKLGRHNFNKQGGVHHPKPKPKPTSKPPHYTTTKSQHQTTPKPPPNSNSATTNPPNPPNPATTNPATIIPATTSTTQDVTTPRPIPVATTTQKGRNTATTTQEGRNTATSTQEGRNTATTTQDGRNTATTTQEGRNTATTTQEGRNTATSTREQRRTTTPEQRRTTAPPAEPAVLDLEVEVKAGNKEQQLIVRIRDGGRRQNRFRLSVGRSEISLSADSLGGALRGLEALAELRQTDAEGKHFLAECEVY